jgi:hypothetical protein
MRREHFNVMWKEISLTFGADYKPSSQKADFTFSKVESIPDAAVPYITDVICRNDACPRNLIAAMHGAYGSWPGISKLRENDGLGYCKHCRGSRQLYVAYDPEKAGNENLYTFSGKCGYCDPYHGGITRERADQRGHVYLGFLASVPNAIGTFFSETKQREVGQIGLTDLVTEAAHYVAPQKRTKVENW